MKKYRYTVLLERKTDGGYRVSCPALPGCRAFGSTKKEAVQNIKLSIHHKLDVFAAKGKPIPRDGDSIPEYA
jgi:predicted RNase H-like HicB family nuclease